MECQDWMLLFDLLLTGWWVAIQYLPVKILYFIYADSITQKVGLLKKYIKKIIFILYQTYVLLIKLWNLQIFEEKKRESVKVKVGEKVFALSIENNGNFSSLQFNWKSTFPLLMVSCTKQRMLLNAWE